MGSSHINCLILVSTFDLGTPSLALPPPRHNSAGSSTRGREPISPLSPEACLRVAPPPEALRRAGASAKAGERVRVRGIIHVYSILRPLIY